MTWEERIGEHVGLLGGALTVFAAVAGWMLRAFALGRRFERMEEKAVEALDAIKDHEKRLATLERGEAVAEGVAPIEHQSWQQAMRSCQQLQDERARKIEGLETQMRDFGRTLMDIAGHLGVVRGKVES